MEMNKDYFFILSVISSLIILALAYSRFGANRNNQFKNLAEFSFAFLTMITMSFLSLNGAMYFILLSLLSWFWTLRGLVLVCQDISGKRLVLKDHYIALAAGVILSLVLYILKLSMLIYMAPLAVSYGLVNLSIIYQTYKKIPVEKFGLLEKIFIGSMVTFIFSRLLFPFWISNREGMNTAFMLDTGLMFILNIILYPLYLEKFIIGYLNHALRIRNRQLFNRSTFSEFKILSAGVAHEINNALTIINAKTEQLMRIYKSEEDQKNIKMVLNSADRIGKSIRGLREFIYPKQQITPEVIKVRELLDHVLMLYGQRLRNHGAVIISRGMNNEYIKGYRMQLEQVFLSLINNALETIDKLKDKWIEILSETNKNKIIILIRDSSPGLSNEMADAILKDSFNLKNSEDNGLGLVMDKEIIHKHGGSLEYIKGSSNRTFKLTLPLTNTSEMLEHVPALPEEAIQSLSTH